MADHAFVVLQGDETGQELLDEALRVWRPDVIGFPIDFQTYDLSLENRRRTQNQIVHEAAAAMVEVGFGLKAATVTPEDKSDVRSPNAMLRKEIDGFIVNRILGPYMNESGFLLEEGNTIESLDKAMVDFGMPMGPMALLDEVGIDVAAKVAAILKQHFGDRIQQSRVVDVLYADHRLGKKGGKGLYIYKDGKRQHPDPDVYRLLGIASPHPVDSIGWCG